MTAVNNIIDEAYELFTQKKFQLALEKIETAETELEENLVHSGSSHEEQIENTVSLENFRGFVFLGLNQNDDAQACFEKAIQLKPNSSQACAGLGEVFYLKGLDPEAKIMYEWALDINPNNEFAKGGLKKVNKLLNLSEDHNSLDQDTLEGEFLEKFNQYLTLAFELFETKKFNESLDKINHAEDILKLGLMSNAMLSKIASLENFRGFNYLGLHQFDDATSAFEKALNLNPTSSQACAGLGELFYLKGLDTNAKTMFEWAVLNNPENQFAVAGLTKVNKVLGLPENDNKLTDGQ
ncbi:MAG: hypothetical protein CMF23_06270 [Ignavibacteriae bacterium]|nr:hypothetical protein [Ignavibacteriota bacterium]